MKKTRFILLTFLIMLFCFSSIGVSADELDNLKEKQNEIDNQAAETKKQLEGVTQEKAATMADLDALNTALDKIQAEITQLNTDLEKAEADLVRQQAEYDELQANLLASQDKMKNRISSIYVNGDVSYLDVLFCASSVSDFLSNFVFFEKIIEQDQDIIGTIRENKQLAKDKLDELAATKAQIETLTASKKEQETAYNAQVKDKEEVVATLMAQEDTLEEILAEFRAESASIASEIQAIYAAQEAAKKAAEEKGETYTPPVIYNGNGSFAYPVAVHGIRTQNYGGSHTGVDIATSAGTGIIAAEDGVVILVRYLNRSYGHYVVIDHGSNISTLYAHMNDIYVSAGDSVSRGQTIGTMGSTGNSTGPHLHFEVRVNGSCTNPDNYI